MIGNDTLTTQSVSRIVQQSAFVAGFAGCEFGGIA